MGGAYDVYGGEERCM